MKQKDPKPNRFVGDDDSIIVTEPKPQPKPDAPKPPKKRRPRGAGSLFRIREIWWIGYRSNGQRVRESTGQTRKSVAEALLLKRTGARAHGLAVIPNVEKVLFSEAVKSVEHDYTNNGRRSLKDLQRRIKKHILPRLGALRLAAITVDEIRRYTAERLEQGASQATVNRELAIMKRTFRLAQRAGKLAMVPAIDMLQESAPRAGFFEPAALKAVLAQLPADLRQPIRFAAETGWRFRSEVLKLEWRRVDLKSGEVRLDAGTTKSGAGRVIFMTAEMRTILEEQQRLQKKMKAAGHIEPLVFVRWSGEGKPRSIRSYAGAWRAACRRAGQPGRLIHDLRRTAARRFVRSGLQPAVAQRLTGHATPSVFQRYNIISEADLRDAAKVLDKAAGR